jgi:TldD protein
MTTLHPLDAISISFPVGVYADVRLERTTAHSIVLRDGVLEEVQTTTETGALLRVLKHGRWLYASTTALDKIDQALAELARSEALSPVEATSGIDGLAVHQAARYVFDDERVDHLEVPPKLALLSRFTGGLGRAAIKTWSAQWSDTHRDRRFVSSRGADVRHDYQECGLRLRFTVGEGARAVEERFVGADHRYSGLVAQEKVLLAALEETLDKCEHFVADAEAVQAGTATVVLSPEVAGVFAHESFGHKSEADFMLGDPAMLEAWAMGTSVASALVTITDGGADWGSGYMPFDDEGQPTTKTVLIDQGVLVGRLHSAMTAAALDETPTANARAISFRFEPIVRMTTTTFAAGTFSREDLFKGVDDGYFIETFKHGSGMSTFTIAPGLCWRIRNGELAEPVRIAVITGTVFETLNEIDGLSDQVEIPFLVGGGCGKMEQWPLSVGFGGPYVRVRKMSVA